MFFINGFFILTISVVWRILNFIFSKNIVNFFYIYSFFVASFYIISFPFHWFWWTIQSQRTYRCATFRSPEPLHELLELSSFFCYCNDMLADFRAAINATSVTFKRPSSPRRGTKNAVCRPCNNIKSVSFTRFFQDQTIIPHQRLGFFKDSFKSTQEVALKKLHSNARLLMSYNNDYCLKHYSV